MEANTKFPPKLKLESPYDPAMPLLGTYQKESTFKYAQYINLYPCYYCTIHNSYEMESV